MTEEDFRLLRSATARWACRRGFTKADAEDLAQEAILRLLLAWGAIGNPAAWVQTAARHEGIDELRRRSSFGRFLARYGASPSQTRADRDLPIELEAILGRLPVRSRLLLELTAQGYTQREVAARLGCSIKIVGALVGRARRRARALRDRSVGDG